MKGDSPFNYPLLGVAFLTIATSATAQKRPNVLFLLADDLGWADLACYGSSFYETPHLDQLAQEGMLFTDAYAAAPVSSPTRVSIQTGRYPLRSGVTDYIRGRYHQPQSRKKMLELCPVLPPNNQFNMPLEEVTIAEILQKEGYRTAHIGKWHCAEDSLFFPQYQGYEINIAGCGKGSPSAGGYFVPYNNPYLPDGPKGEYLTDRLGDECVKVIRKFQNDPFFISFPFYQVHTPLIGKADKVSYFKAKAERLGLDTLSNIFEESPEWEALQPFSEKNYRERRIQNHAVYAAMIASMDENIGKVIAELKRLSLYDQTIIIFTSDNGGLSTAEGSPTSNRPLRTGKGHLYEGGIREPLIAVWKGHIQQGSTSSFPVSSVDYLPTIVDLVGLKLPTKLTIDGISLRPTLMGKHQKRDALYWHYPHYPNQGARPAGAIREGEYKLIEFYDTGEVELYNIKKDLSEQNNLADAMPQLRDRLTRKLHRWRESAGGKMPTANPNYKPISTKQEHSAQ